jgi:hypothetical protein
MNIQYYVKDVYGIPTRYIANDEAAKLVRQLTGKKTVSSNDLEALEKLGHEIIRVDAIRS